MSAFDAGARPRKKRLPEQQLNDHVIAAMKGMDPVRIENTVGEGQPDINFRDGWIESKVIRKWPVRRDTIVRVDHYNKEQRGWHRKRRAAGGLVLVVIQVDRDYLIFDALWAAGNLGYSTREDMLGNALMAMQAEWDGQRFHRWIKEYTENFLTSRGYSATIAARWRGQS